MKSFKASEQKEKVKNKQPPNKSKISPIPNEHTTDTTLQIRKKIPQHFQTHTPVDENHPL